MDFAKYFWGWDLREKKKWAKLQTITFNYGVMKKFLVLILIICCVSGFCAGYNRGQAEACHNGAMDSVSTTFTRDNVTYRGVRVWSKVNNPDKTYLCLNVNDTLLIVTDSEALFSSPLYSLGRKEMSKEFRNADIVHADEALPIGAFVMSEGDTLIYRKTPVPEANYQLARGIVRNNKVNPNKNLLIGESLDKLFKRIGLNDSEVLHYANKSNCIVFVNSESVEYHARLTEGCPISLDSNMDAIFLTMLDSRIHSVEYGGFGKHGMKLDNLSIKEDMEL